jgi:ribosome-binding factor A
MSKRTREPDVASESLNFEFERALEENEHQLNDRGRRLEQKTRQLCRQVQRALSLALSGQFLGGVLEEVFIVEVSAMAGCGRLLVQVAIPTGQLASTVLAELRDHTPRLRSIVAECISRKRLPELSFVVVPLGMDAYE